jgi:hypothetical protein
VGFPTLAQLVITEESMKNHSDPSTAQRQSETPVPTKKISVLKIAQLTLKTLKLALIFLDVSGLGVGGFVLWEEIVQALLDFIAVE